MKTKDRSGTVVIGRIGSPSGLRGEMRVTLYAQDSINLKEGKVLLLKHAGKKAEAAGGTASRKPGQDNSGEKKRAVQQAEGGADDNGIIRAAIKSVRYQKDRPVISLEGFTDRTAAEALRDMEISIEAEDLEPLPEGEHYVRDLIGCRVVDTREDRTVGTLRDVIQNTAQSILEVETEEGRTVLIPAVDAFLRTIDEEAGIIEVELIPGFLD